MKRTMSYMLFSAMLASSVLHAQAGILDKFKKKEADDPERVELSEEVKKSETKGAGNLRYSVSVAAIEKSYSGVFRWDVADAFRLMLTDGLQSSGHFIVIGEETMRDAAMREQDLATSGRTAKGKKTAKTGRLTPVQLLVRGAVTHVEKSASGKSGGLGFRGIRIGGSGGNAEVNVTIYFVDSTTGQVKASQKIVGVAKKKGLSFGYHGGALGGLTGDFAGFKKDNLGKATEHAAAQAIEYLVEQLEGIEWEGTVIMSKNGEFMCNRGSREGVEKGLAFDVGSIEEIVDPDTGETLDTDMTRVGRLEVTRVKEKICWCKAIRGERQIEKGMTIFLAD